MKEERNIFDEAFEEVNFDNTETNSEKEKELMKSFREFQRKIEKGEDLDEECEF